MKKTPKKVESSLEQISALFGIPPARHLDLARPMRLDVSRLGYDGEGLRLTLSIDSPYRYNAEVKLSRGDAEWLVKRLQQELANPKNTNLPEGDREGDGRDG
jgi:hypothetical protein